MWTRSLGGGLLVLVVAGTACGELLGNDFTVEEGAGGAAGQHTTTAGSGGGTSTTTSQGGGGEAPCVAATAVGCEPGEKCTLLDLETLEVGCIPAGEGGPATPCAEDSDCNVGLFCDEFTGVCAEICNDPGSTSICGLGWCIVTEVEGFGLCTVGCDPTAPQACGNPDLVCAYWGPGEGDESTFHCAVPADDGGSRQEGELCPLIEQIPILHSCAPGLTCLEDFVDPPDQGVCVRWCTPVGTPAQCLDGKNCIEFPDPGIVQHGTEYGFCF